MTTVEHMEEALTALQEWVACLKSGEFQQGVAALKLIHNDETTPRYCCVGVLVDTQFPQLRLKADDAPSGLGVVREANVTFYLNSSQYSSTWDRISAVVPGEAREFFEDRGIDIDWSELYDMNDDARMTFSEIAEHITDTYIRPLEALLACHK